MKHAFTLYIETAGLEEPASIEELQEVIQTYISARTPEDKDYHFSYFDLVPNPGA